MSHLVYVLQKNLLMKAASKYCKKIYSVLTMVNIGLIPDDFLSTVSSVPCYETIQS